MTGPAVHGREAGYAMPCRREAGYAMVAAVAAIALLGLMSLGLVAAGAGMTAGVAAEVERARLMAAADAGLAIAASRLAEPDRARRWSIDGRTRNLRFAGTDLIVRIEDERGKIPLNQLTEEQVRAMFESFGAPPEIAATQADAFLDWIDDDDEARENGAEAPYYAPLGRRPRNGALHSLGELLLIRGITADVYDRLNGAASIYSNEREGFDERYAAPLALSVMSGGGLDSPAVIDRERELAGQRPAIELADAETLVGRPLTIRVVALRPGGGRFTRATLIELTGRDTQPYVVRGIA